MALSEKRQGEIALAILMAKMDREGIKIGSSLRRELGDIAKAINVPLEEVEEFSKILVVRLLGRSYRMQHVSLTMDSPYSKESEKK